MKSQNPIGQPFVQLTTVESTNNYAMRQVQAQMAGHGSTWFAHEQTAGKGQRGKTWSMDAGQNIILSTVIEPLAINVGNSFILSVAVALACYDFFSAYALDETKIKWPNDLYWRDRKAGGILIENNLSGSDWKYSIVGIGININQTSFPPHLPNPVSLKQITGKTYDPVALAKELCGYLEKRWLQIQKNQKDLVQEYNNKLYKLGEDVKFKKENATFIATVKGVNNAGELIVFTGSETTIPFGGCQWLMEESTI